jgi:large subunit ribosomal protein L13
MLTSDFQAWTGTFVMLNKTTIATAKTVKPEWLHIDATDAVVGRLAVQIATILRGKHKATYTPNIDTGDFVIVTNVEKIKFTGRKWDQKSYQTFSGYAGGQKIIPAKEMLAKKPEEILYQAVKRMVPRNRLGRAQMNKLKIYAGAQHPHQAQKPKEFKVS